MSFIKGLITLSRLRIFVAQGTPWEDFIPSDSVGSSDEESIFSLLCEKWAFPRVHLIAGNCAVAVQRCDGGLSSRRAFGLFIVKGAKSSRL